MCNLLPAVFVVLSLTTAGCRPLYSGQVVFQGGHLTAAVEGYMTLYAQIYEGSRAPLILRGVTGRCEDQEICQVAVVSGDRGDEIRVAGKRPGRTQLKIKYVHPIRKKPGWKIMKVRFVTGRVTRLKVGQPAVTKDRLLFVEGPRAQLMSCAESYHHRFSYNGFLWKSIMNDRVQLFECENPVEVIKGKRSFYDYAATPNRWNNAPFGSTVLVCATLSLGDKKWSSISVYSWNGKDLLSREGVVPDELCKRVSDRSTAE
jgi:hypothetical protein